MAHRRLPADRAGAGVMRALWIALAGVLGACAHDAGREASGIGPAELAGDWAAACDGFAEGARCSLNWVVGADVERMEVAYQVVAADGALLFGGEGEYRAAASGFAGMWSDTSGSQRPLQSTFADGALTTLWGTPETEEGRTRYALDDDGGLSVTDWVKVEGDWRQFMHADYRRTEAATE